MANSDLVVSTETGGLGNRLKSWVSSMRLAADARVHWPVTKNMPAAFGELFVNDCAVDAVPAGASVYGSWRLAILPQDEAHLPAGFATVGAGAHPLVRGLGKAWWSLTGERTDRYRFMVFPKQHSRRSTRADARHIDLEYERIPQYFRDAYGELFRRDRRAARDRGRGRRSGRRRISTPTSSACRCERGATTRGGTASITCRRCAA